jgi:hypothetical protein
LQPGVGSYGIPEDEFRGGIGLKIHAVSTFNAEGKRLYGDRMMGSFVRNWPREIGLTVYSEGWSETLHRVSVVDLHSASSWLSEFKARHAGRTFKDYRHDAVRFSHKVAAICAADEAIDCDVLIWMDGDIFTHAPVPLECIADLAPKEEWVAWLDRERAYPECGFLMFNRLHPRHLEMMARLHRMYEGDELFSLSEYHDSFVIEQAVKAAGVAVKSLSGSGRKTGHPLINGPLGAFMDHCKGQRKMAGRSSKGELVSARREAHWR